MEFFLNQTTILTPYKYLLQVNEEKNAECAWKMFKIIYVCIIVFNRYFARIDVDNFNVLVTQRSFKICISKYYIIVENIAKFLQVYTDNRDLEIYIENCKIQFSFHTSINVDRDEYKSAFLTNHLRKIIKDDGSFEQFPYSPDPYKSRLY